MYYFCTAFRYELVPHFGIRMLIYFDTNRLQDLPVFRTNPEPLPKQLRRIAEETLKQHP